MKLTLDVSRRTIKDYEYHNLLIPSDASKKLGLEYKDKVIIEILEVIKNKTSIEKGSDIA